MHSARLALELREPAHHGPPTQPATRCRGMYAIQWVASLHPPQLYMHDPEFAVFIDKALAMWDDDDGIDYEE